MTELTKKERKPIITLDSVPTIAAWLVLALTIIAFVLSYDALRHVAEDNGKTDWQSWLWPLLIDFALIIFSIAVLRANLLQETAWRRWALVALATGATVYFNYVHAGPQLNAKIVAVVPPIVLLFSFETLVGMLKSNAKRALERARRIESAEEVARLQSELAELRRRYEETEHQEEISRNEANELVHKMAVTKEELDKMYFDFGRMQERVVTLEAQAKALADWQLMNATAKAVFIAQHTNGDRPAAQALADALGCALSTVTRAYKKAEEGKTK